MIAWVASCCVFIALGVVAARSRFTAQLIFMLFGLGLAVLAVAVYWTEVRKESQADPAALDVFARENPWTPDGVVALFVIIFGLPWLLSLLAGWAGGLAIRHRTSAAQET